MKVVKLRCTCPTMRFLATVDASFRYHETNCSSCGMVVLHIRGDDGSVIVRRQPRAVVH